jgi:hypothetical protein
MNIEDRIAALSQRTDASAFCWLICFEKRPLQGIPPGGSGAHLMAFSSETAAKAFIAGRRKYYGSEPLSAIKIDSAESLKALLEEPSFDARYAPPPCGVVIDFDYRTSNARWVLSAMQARGMSAAEILRAFQVAPPVPGILPPAIPQRGKGGWSTATKRIAMGIGGLAVVAILFFGIRAIYGGMKSGKIPAFGFLNTPTMTATATRIPTATPTITPTEKSWKIHYTDRFENNKWGWPELQNDKSETCGTENMFIDYLKLVWTIEVSDGCVWWQYPSFVQMKDFDLSMDVELMAGSSNADMGLVYSAAGDDSYSLLFRIDPANSTFTVESLQTDWKTIIDWKYSDAIQNTGVNRLRMVVKNNQFTFYVNEVEVGSTFDSTITSGIVGITLGTYKTGDSVSVSFDDLELFTNR